MFTLEFTRIYWISHVDFTSVIVSVKLLGPMILPQVEGGHSIRFQTLTQDPIKASAWKLPLSHTDQRTFFLGRVILVCEPWTSFFFWEATHRGTRSAVATNHDCGADSRKATIFSQQIQAQARAYLDASTTTGLGRYLAAVTARFGIGEQRKHHNGRAKAGRSGAWTLQTLNLDKQSLPRLKT